MGLPVSIPARGTQHLLANGRRTRGKKFLSRVWRLPYRKCDRWSTACCPMTLVLLTPREVSEPDHRTGRGGWIELQVCHSGVTPAYQTKSQTTLRYLSVRATDGWCYFKAYMTGEKWRRKLFEACPTDDACTNSSTGISKVPLYGPPSHL